MFWQRTVKTSPEYSESVINIIREHKRIRSNEITRLLPVVILTSSSEEDDIINGYKLGANSYIRKPVDFTQFVDAIKPLGLYWLIWDEPPVIKTVSCAA